jgi:GDPmannose 4,6-dehydratase
MKIAWDLMQLENGGDYVFSTGRLHSVRELIETSLKVLGIEIFWEGSGLTEIGKDKNGKTIVRVSNDFYRVENKDFYGDNSKIRNLLNWNQEVDFYKMIELMVKSDYNRLK